MFAVNAVKQQRLPARTLLDTTAQTVGKNTRKSTARNAFDAGNRAGGVCVNKEGVSMEDEKARPGLFWLTLIGIMLVIGLVDGGSIVALVVLFTGGPFLFTVAVICGQTQILKERTPEEWKRLKQERILERQTAHEKACQQRRIKQQEKNKRRRARWVKRQQRQAKRKALTQKVYNWMLRYS